MSGKQMLLGQRIKLENRRLGVKLKLFDTCLMLYALTYGMEAWANIRSYKISQKIQVKALKRIFQLQVSTT